MDRQVLHLELANVGNLVVTHIDSELDAPISDTRRRRVDEAIPRVVDERHIRMLLQLRPHPREKEQILDEDSPTAPIHHLRSMEMKKITKDVLASLLRRAHASSRMESHYSTPQISSEST